MFTVITQNYFFYFKIFKNSELSQFLGFLGGTKSVLFSCFPRFWPDEDKGPFPWHHHIFKNKHFIDHYFITCSWAGEIFLQTGGLETQFYIFAFKFILKLFEISKYYLKEITKNLYVYLFVFFGINNNVGEDVSGVL